MNINCSEKEMDIAKKDSDSKNKVNSKNEKNNITL